MQFFCHEQLGYRAEWLLVPLWLLNVVPAIYAARVARDLGKRGVTFGILAGLGPPMLFFVLLHLRSQALHARFNRLS